MSIFNNEKKTNGSKQNISLEDFEKKIEERKEEYHRLNEILRGMRAEVSKLMDEIKKLSDEVVKKNAEKFLVEQEVDELTQTYHLLQKDVELEQNKMLTLRNSMEKLKDEISTDLSIQEELIKIKKEYDLISKQVLEKKLELNKLDQDDNNIQKTTLEEKISAIPIIIKKKPKRCSAKNKNGLKCKRLALDNSEFCSIHSKKSKG